MWLVKIVSLKLVETCHQSRGREWRGIDAEREFQRATISAGESLSCVTQPRAPARIRASMIETVFCRASSLPSRKIYKIGDGDEDESSRCIDLMVNQNRGNTADLVLRSILLNL